jgi:dipeptidyl aminopeptidase/acylaminoacyl peptidase
VADVRTGKGREIWRAASGKGSAFWLGFMNNERQLFWGANDRIAFPWERTGWMHMYSVSASGGPAVELTPGGEFEVEHVALSPNGSDLVFMSNQGDTDRRHLWRVSIAGGQPQPVTTGKGIEYWPMFTSDGAAVVFQASTARTPPQVELFRMSEAANGPVAPSARHVLAPNITPKEFPSAALVEPQQVIFSSLDSVQVHGQLYLPSDYQATQRYPALVFLHGGPNMQQLLGYHYHRLEYYQKMYGMNQYLANHGYIVMSVNYRRGIGYGLEFREPQSPVGASPREDPDVIDIIAAGQYLKKRPDVDPDRVGIWGGSAGGTRTILGLAFGSDVFVAGVNFHGVATQALGKTQGWKSPVLIVHGDDDRNVPFNLSVSLASELRGRGVEVEELILPNEGHSFFQHSTWLRVFHATDDFFARKIKGRRTEGGTP